MANPTVRQSPRSGLRIRGHRGNPEVRAALIRYASWLRLQFSFPIRVPVYLSPLRTIVTMHGEHCTASFFAPFDRDEEPYIRIPTGDYTELLAELGRDGALAAFLCSLSHEVLHYRQWVETGETTEDSIEDQAGALVLMYAQDVDHP